MDFGITQYLTVGKAHIPSWGLAGRLGSLVHQDWPDREDTEGLLQQVGEHCWELHNLVTATFFDYQMGDVPPR